MSLEADLVRKVEQNLKAFGVRPRDNLLLALSGGTDSMALLDILMELGCRREGEIAAAHLDHGVRGAESMEEALHIRSLSARLGFRLATDRLESDEVRALTGEYGSQEAALRSLRYRFLENTADKMKSNWILTAHQADDQAETVLFRAARDMNWRSMRGIPSREGRVIRPLIAVRRTDLSGYCALRNLQPLEDPSNRDLSFARNRIRQVILPAMEELFSPGIHRQLIRLSDAAIALANWEQAALARCVSRGDLDPRPGIPLAVFEKIPSQLRERAVLTVFERILTRYPGKTILREALSLITGEKRGRIRVSDEMELIVDRGVVTVVHSAKRRRTRPIPERTWNVPGRIDIPELSLALEAVETVYEGCGRFPGGFEALVSKSALKLPLKVRTRVPGDRFWPLGMKGSKSLRRFLMDRKIPRHDRERIVLVLDSGGRIVWVPGLEISQAVRIPLEGSSEAVYLKMEKTGIDV